MKVVTPWGLTISEGHKNSSRKVSPRLKEPATMRVWDIPSMDWERYTGREKSTNKLFKNTRKLCLFSAEQETVLWKR